MSNRIIHKAGKKSGGKEKLSRYIRRVLREKGLSLREVQRRSGNAITQGYVSHIIQGTYSNLTVEKLRALARGIGVDEEELFRVARGLSPVSKLPPPRRTPDSSPEITKLARKLVSKPDLAKVLQEVADLSPRSRAAVLETAKDLRKAERRRQRGR